MSWELLAIIAAVIFAGLLVAFRKNPYVKKYWKFSLILLPAVFIILLRIIMNKKTDRGEKEIEENATALKDAITDIKEELQEVNMTAAVEVTVAKTENAVVEKELAEVVKIDDRRERLKRLADMMG
jgi:predicted S18 family serine protease